MTHPIENSIIRIYDNLTHKICGVAFLIKENFAITCAHVIKQINIKGVPDHLIIGDMPFLSESIKLSAEVVYYDLTTDIAGLEIHNLPSEAKPVSFAPTHNVWKHAFSAFGFPAGYDNGVWADGEIREANAIGWLQIIDTKQTGYFISQGFSGGPVWDETLNAVIGMLVATDKTVSTRAAFVIPTKVICAVWDKVPLPLGRLYDVPNLPEFYVKREDELSEIKNFLIGDSRETKIGITSTSKVGIEGMGGAGKTVVALALASDEKIRSTFTDGIVWCTLGQTPNIKARQIQIIDMLGGNNKVIEDEQHGKFILSELFSKKKILLILDDVWEIAHLSPFDCANESSKIMFTTRNARVISAFNAQQYILGMLNNEQALKLLSEASNQDFEILPPITKEIIKECGNLPLALAMVGACLKHEYETWESIYSRLISADLEKLAQEFPDYPYPNVFRAIEVSVKLLSQELQKLYLELAVFPEDALVPITVFQLLWGTLGYSEHETKNILRDFSDKSLLKLHRDNNITIHDLHHDYMVKQAKNIRKLHTRLITAYSKTMKKKVVFNLEVAWENGRNDGYYYQHIAYHLYQAQKIKELIKLLLNYNWYLAKIEHTNIYGLIRDLDLLDSHTDVNLVKQALILSIPSLTKDINLLEGQLIGRLLFVKSPMLKRLLREVSSINKGIWIKPRLGCLTKPNGPLMRTIFQYGSEVIRNILISSDGKYLLSTSWDVILVWDFDSGEVIHEIKDGDLNGEDDDIPPNCIAITNNNTIVWASKTKIKTLTLTNETPRGFIEKTPNNIGSIPQQAKAITLLSERVVMAGYDNGFIELLDLQQEKILHRQKISDNKITALAALSDLNIYVVGDENGNVKLFNLSDHQIMHELNNLHSKRISKLIICKERSCLISGSHDGYVKIWDIDNQNLIFAEQHDSMVSDLALSDDQTIVASSSYDTSVSLWDLETYSKILSFKPHNSRITKIFLKNIRSKSCLITGSDDHSIKLFDLSLIHTLVEGEHHSGFLRKILFLSDRKAATSGDDGHIKIWDVQNGELINELECPEIEDFCFSPKNGTIISASLDGKVRIFNIDRVSKPILFESNSSLTSVAISYDGKKIYTGSKEKTLAVWDYDTHNLLVQKAGHKDRIKAISTWSNIIATASYDKAVKIWRDDLQALNTFKGHSRLIMCVVMTTDGKYAISCSADTFIIIWNLTTKKFVKIKAHDDLITSLAISNDNKYLVSTSRDHSIKLWELENYKCICQFIGDDSYVSCAISTNNKIILAGDAMGKLSIFSLVGI